MKHTPDGGLLALSMTSSISFVPDISMNEDTTKIGCCL